MPAPGVTEVKGPVRQRYGSKVPGPRPQRLNSSLEHARAQRVQDGVDETDVLIQRRVEDRGQPGHSGADALVPLPGNGAPPTMIGEPLATLALAATSGTPRP